MNNKIKTAFTLVELLVVIAIIGILSGLIIVGMNSSVRSANIAKIQIFSTSIRDSLLGNLVAEWRFDGSGVADGGSATTAYTQDIWGTNNCTMPGTAPLVYSGNNCVYNACLKFNGTSDYLDCGTGSNVPRANSPITYEAWVYLPAVQSSPGWEGNGIVGWNSVNPTGLLINTARAYFDIRPSSGGVAGVYSAVNLTLNNWHHIVGTYEGNNVVRIYTDTNMERFTGTQTPGSSPTSIYIGRSYNFYLNGTLDNVRIYSAAVPTSQVRDHYYSGINRLLSKNIISKTEYQNKVAQIDNSLARK